MIVVLDTNVLMSGLFWAGPCYDILTAWRDGRFRLLLTTAILDEYIRVAARLSREFPGVDAAGFIGLLVCEAGFCDAVALPERVCSDPDDDKFIECALAAGGMVISGDKHLLAVSGYRGVGVLTPRAFVDRYLSE